MLKWKMSLITILFVVSCSTTKNITIEEPGGMPWKELADGCKQTDELDFVCEREVLEKTYDALVKNHYALQECVARYDYCKDLCEVDLGECNKEKNAWYRKWYIMLPLGLAVGAAIGVITAYEVPR